MIPKRYNFENLGRILSNPQLLIHEASILYHRHIGKQLFHYKYGSPINVTDRDWDNLIILDACRYDTFKKYNSIDGDLKRVVSAGSHSDEFIHENFNEKKLHDTVYITANPHADITLDKNVFHNVIRTYNTTTFSERSFDNYHPETVTDAVLSNYRKYDNKRVIVHYMQPHTPYIGEKACRIRKDLSEKGIELKLSSSREDCDYKSLLKAAKDNHVSESDLNSCYVENLKIVLDEVKFLIDELDGKTVISSDHGELLGSPSTNSPGLSKYDHPPKTYLPELRLVPWLIIHSDNRRDISSDGSPCEKSAPENKVKQQLEALGYTDYE